jgi:transposase InsO family protein
MIFAQAREVYGSPRITAELQDVGLQHSKNFVAKVMKEAGIKAKTARRRFKRTTNSEHSEPVFPNVLQRNFRTLAPNSAWVSDVTYIRTKEGWLYLCVFIDLYSRQVVGWSIKDRLCFEIATDALEMAIGQRDPKPGLIIHTDRGVQYAGARYREILRKRQIVGSMSRIGDCWDNAVAESFFGTLKQELVPKKGFSSKLQARNSIFEFIEVFYNRERRHSTLQFKTPVEFEHAA